MKLRSGILTVVAAAVIAAWVTGAGPVAAHEGTVITTVPAVSTPAGGGGGTEVLPGVAEYSPPLHSAAMVESTDRWSGLSVMAAPTGVLASAAAAVAVLRRRSGRAASPGRLQIAGAFALLFAGVAHCALAPSHWNEGWHLGAFFAASGLLLVGQAAVLWLRPSVAAYRSVVLSTAVMIVLYVATRQMALPLVDHRDPYLVSDIPVKAAELLAAGLAVTALLKARPAPAPATLLARA